MQFIDGRLDLLNSGQGFNDIFEEEISMGEYAGETMKTKLLLDLFFIYLSSYLPVTELSNVHTS